MLIVFPKGQFQSTLPMRGAKFLSCHLLCRTVISIHAPHAGSEAAMGSLFTGLVHFNPRSPCGERMDGRAAYVSCRDFNPRSPCGERTEKLESHADKVNFNPRSPCGERSKNNGYDMGILRFQSTLPMRGAKRPKPREKPEWVFQSTLPMRGANSLRKLPSDTGRISIHAPHAGSETVPAGSLFATEDFNPRSPCGERKEALSLPLMSSIFQSTLPMRGANIFQCNSRPVFDISIHAPHAGSEIFQIGSPKPQGNFNPRSPCGERKYVVSSNEAPRPISIHAPHAGSESGR